MKWSDSRSDELAVAIIYGGNQCIRPIVVQPFLFRAAYRVFCCTCIMLLKYIITVMVTELRSQIIGTRGCRR